MTTTWVSPVTLQLDAADEARLGAGVATLGQLREEHAPGLWEAIDGATGAAETLKYHPGPPPRSEADMLALVRARLKMQAEGLLGAPFVAFVILEHASGRPIGITTYLDIQPANRALEIGFTWIGPRWQRSRVNTECKYLLLRHAFEGLGVPASAVPAADYPGGGAIRVQFKGDGRNVRSLNAVKRLGATYEGTLRRTRILHDGFVRDAWYCSVLREEWFGVVKGRLEGMLRQ